MNDLIPPPPTVPPHAPAVVQNALRPNRDGDPSGSHHQDQARKLQDSLEQVEALPDPAARALVQHCLEGLLALHSDGLARLLQLLQQGLPGTQTVFDRVIRDPAIQGLLLIHGLHPLDLETRLHEALEKVRPYMHSHGGNVELVSLENGFAKLRLHGTCQTCSASTITLELSVRRAVEEACPDLAGFEVE